MGRESLKRRVREAVEEHGAAAVRVAQEILDHPETGFREENTARLVADWFRGLGLPYRSGLALTGVRADIKGGSATGGSARPTVAVMGELDSLVVPGHPHADATTSAAHACGHHAQVGMLLAVAAALNEPDIREALHGNVALMAPSTGASRQQRSRTRPIRWGLQRETMGITQALSVSTRK